MDEPGRLPTALISSDVSRRHDTGTGHPECIARFDAIMDRVRQADYFDSLLHLQPRSATNEEILRCHTAEYVEIARRDIAEELPALSTGDTVICPQSLEPALMAAGGACLAVDTVVERKAKNAFCVHRPPGHHATPNKGMGFCVFNNAAIAARHAQQTHGFDKVLIVDWDVHHGNGTQDIFYDDSNVFFFSTHQWPLYPGTGDTNETGHGDGLGTTRNCPFPAGSGRREILGAFERDLLPAVDDFQPDLVIVSAGFDSRIDDPLGGFLLTDDDFADLTALMLQVAADHADGRLVSVLEGGYNLDGLAKAADAHLRRLTQD